MQAHGPKRVYTPKSLEFWFEKFEEDWAAHFSAEELELGRQIYRDGAVREVELGAQDAIIHRRVEKRDEYAVIEWEDKGRQDPPGAPQLTTRARAVLKRLDHH